MKSKSRSSIKSPLKVAGRRARIALAAGLLLVAGAAAWAILNMRGPQPAVSSTRIPARPTFHRDVAPIIRSHCSTCHQPGQAAPFPLLDYADVKKRLRDIREAVEQRIMPPWMPDPGDGPFVGQRSLSQEQIAVLTRWMEQGAPEGTVEANAPFTPRPEWQLGKPDLIVRMAEAFPLAADGPDIYRNFVLSVPGGGRRFVKGVELKPGNERAVHHAFIRIDATRESRTRDEREPGIGFGGLHTPPTAQTPEGQFLSWQPGKINAFVPRGLAWTLEPGSDLVLQMHLRPSGKNELVQPAVALYFTDEAPTNTPFKIGFRSFGIDIPAGASDQIIRDSYVLAADVDVLSILPHAHYLGKRLEAFAKFPDVGSPGTELEFAL